MERVPSVMSISVADFEKWVFPIKACNSFLIIRRLLSGDKVPIIVELGSN